MSTLSLRSFRFSMHTAAILLMKASTSILFLKFWHIFCPLLKDCVTSHDVQAGEGNCPVEGLLRNLQRLWGSKLCMVILLFGLFYCVYTHIFYMLLIEMHTLFWLLGASNLYSDINFLVIMSNLLWVENLSLCKSIPNLARPLFRGFFHFFCLRTFLNCGTGR